MQREEFYRHEGHVPMWHLRSNPRNCRDIPSVFGVRRVISMSTTVSGGPYPHGFAECLYPSILPSYSLSTTAPTFSRSSKPTWRMLASLPIRYGRRAGNLGGGTRTTESYFAGYRFARRRGPASPQQAESQSSHHEDSCGCDHSADDPRSGIAGPIPRG